MLLGIWTSFGSKIIIQFRVDIVVTLDSCRMQQADVINGFFSESYYFSDIGL